MEFTCQNVPKMALAYAKSLFYCNSDLEVCPSQILCDVNAALDKAETKYRARAFVYPGGEIAFFDEIRRLETMKAVLRYWAPMYGRNRIEETNIEKQYAKFLGIRKENKSNNRKRRVAS